ncbi:hypothetical protein PVAP13_9NG015702 [Panicum virgatum]|uniref:Uncharacterized protein n=1 Tax=Panicum virgatum TaxID=38727 RepID=A0A8T0MF19_PANVG|nr:hypothetical protein PVAP13_9NG015702 [Panicum virgatum]
MNVEGSVAGQVGNGANVLGSPRDPPPDRPTLILAPPPRPPRVSLAGHLQLRSPVEGRAALPIPSAAASDVLPRRPTPLVRLYFASPPRLLRAVAAPGTGPPPYAQPPPPLRSRPPPLVPSLPYVSPPSCVPPAARRATPQISPGAVHPTAAVRPTRGPLPQPSLLHAAVASGFNGSFPRVPIGDRRSTENGAGDQFGPVKLFGAGSGNAVRGSGRGRGSVPRPRPAPLPS